MKNLSPQPNSQKKDARPRQKPVILYQGLEILLLICVKLLGLAKGIEALREVVLHTPVSLTTFYSGEKMLSEYLSEFQFSNSQMS